MPICVLLETFVSVCDNLCLPAIPKGTALELEMAFQVCTNGQYEHGLAPEVVVTLKLPTGIIQHR
jgi:hypothetical protein